MQKCLREEEGFEFSDSGLQWFFCCCCFFSNKLFSTVNFTLPFCSSFGQFCPIFLISQFPNIREKNPHYETLVLFSFFFFFSSLFHTWILFHNITTHLLKELRIFTTKISWDFFLYFLLPKSTKKLFKALRISVYLSEGRRYMHHQRFAFVLLT